MTITRSNITRIMTAALVFLTTFQGAIPQFFPIANSQAIASAVILFAVVGITAWQQYLSVEVKNSALWPTLIVAILATLGGLNNLLNVVIVSTHLNHIIGLSLTVLITALSVLSKTLWPTVASSQIEQIKANLVVENKNLSLSKASVLPAKDQPIQPPTQS